ncbi:hypothetical protein L1987_26483 [Smallanthus sonchifolius]|uniref:Uncharacterized protein n=1 Tax=Smallanthus sonchifolius TaxID=185202 RepID=A0ACB9IBH8_9ASTR|nr:hypothetical protein L1987_26483 [Smallanthus sonchifolius]
MGDWVPDCIGREEQAYPDDSTGVGKTEDIEGGSGEVEDGEIGGALNDTLVAEVAPQGELLVSENNECLDTRNGGRQFVSFEANHNGNKVPHKRILKKKSRELIKEGNSVEKVRAKKRPRCSASDPFGLNELLGLHSDSVTANPIPEESSNIPIAEKVCDLNMCATTGSDEGEGCSNGAAGDPTVEAMNASNGDGGDLVQEEIGSER